MVRLVLKNVMEILFEVLLELRWVSLPVIGQRLRNMLLFIGNTEPLPLAKRKWLDFIILIFSEPLESRIGSSSLTKDTLPL